MNTSHSATVKSDIWTNCAIITSVIAALFALYVSIAAIGSLPYPAFVSTVPEIWVTGSLTVSNSLALFSYVIAIEKTYPSPALAPKWFVWGVYAALFLFTASFASLAISIGARYFGLLDRYLS